MKVLWFCDRPIEEAPDRRDGTSYTSMAKALIDTNEIKLSVISQDRIKSIRKSDFKNICQEVVPCESLRKNGLPSERTIKAIVQFVEKTNPDLIHVWGTENYWGLLTSRSIIKKPTLLEIAGLKFASSDVYYGGLSILTIARCLGLLEILRLPKSIIFGKKRFKYWGNFEKEMILKHKYISTQSDFVRMHIRNLNPNACIYETGIMLRDEFYKAKSWDFEMTKNSENPVIFASSALPFPYKGLHILIWALAILKKKYPNIVLNIAGDIQKKGLRQTCYARFLTGEIKRLGLCGNVNFLGSLDADLIIEQLYNSSLVVVPSFIETYSIALAEAMYLGVPVVASYAGAMPELAKDGESALFFPIGDAVSCAMQIDRVLSDENLAKKLSENARKIGLLRNNKQLVLKKQLEIYNDILNKELNTRQ